MKQTEQTHIKEKKTIGKMYEHKHELIYILDHVGRIHKFQSFVLLVY